MNDLAVIDYVKIALFTVVIFMVIKFALRQTQEMAHFAETF